MANPEAITALPLGMVKLTDVYPATDTTDTTASPSGTTKKYTIKQLSQFLGGIVITNSLVKAYSSVNQNGITGDGTTATIIFGTVLTDINSDYNASTGIFTAPATGTYLATVTLQISGWASDNDAYQINFTGTSADSQSPISYNTVASVGSLLNGATIECNATQMLNMNKNDTLHISVYAAGHASKNINVLAGQNSTYFGIFLIN